MRKYLRIVDNNRATKGIRFANFMIDRVIFNMLFFGIGFLGVLIDKVIGSYYFTNLILKASEINGFVDVMITTLLFSLYTFLIEYFTKGRTIAKYITGTKVITIDGQTPTLNEFFIRNISRAVPFDALSFLGETGWHDSWSDTRVVNIKNYESERQAKSEIEALGIKEIV
jgi:uncharacterized RDD family membrane protein YckC